MLDRESRFSRFETVSKLDIEDTKFLAILAFKFLGSLLTPTYFAYTKGVQLYLEDVEKTF